MPDNEKPRMTKRAAKRRALLAAADMTGEAARASEIFMNEDTPDADVELCRQALLAVANELYAKAAKLAD